MFHGTNDLSLCLIKRLMLLLTDGRQAMLFSKRSAAYKDCSSLALNAAVEFMCPSLYNTFIFLFNGSEE